MSDVASLPRASELEESPTFSDQAARVLLPARSRSTARHWYAVLFWHAGAETGRVLPP